MDVKNLHDKGSNQPMNNCMKIKPYTTVLAIGLAGLLAGCASTKKNDVSIESALEQLGRGFAKMKVAELNELTNQCFVDSHQTNFNTGLFVTDATVTFNVTASSSKSNTLALDVSAAVPQSPVSGKVSDAFTSASSLTRGNQVTVHFASPFFGTSKVTKTDTNKVVTVTEEQPLTPPDVLAAWLKVVFNSTNGFTPPVENIFSGSQTKPTQ